MLSGQVIFQSKLVWGSRVMSDSYAAFVCITVAEKCRVVGPGKGGKKKQLMKSKLMARGSLKTTQGETRIV